MTEVGAFSDTKQAVVIPFFKMQGSGNDFVIVDNRNGLVAGHLEPLARSICDRQRGVGGDGLILLERSPTGDFAMRYFNRDGTEGEICGNGARCIARHAFTTGIAAESMLFDSAVGEIRAKILSDGVVKIEMPQLSQLVNTMEVVALGKTFRVYFLHIGVPHAVVIVDDHLDELDVDRFGKALRHHNAFAPSGANVNFVYQSGPRKLAVRTFERGVEEETMSCGSGAIACSVVFHRFYEGSTEWLVSTHGGDTLEVSLAAAGYGFRASLTGPTELVFEGTYSFTALEKKSSAIDRAEGTENASR